jgi:hypothetical protein
MAEMAVAADRDDDALMKLALIIGIRMAAAAPWPDIVPSAEPDLSTFLLAVTAATGSLTGMACLLANVVPR